MELLFQAGTQEELDFALQHGEVQLRQKVGGIYANVSLARHTPHHEKEVCGVRD